MVTYLSIDGDDIGSKIAKCYLENDDINLSRTVEDLKIILSQICERLNQMNFEILFCAADGIVGKGVDLDCYSFANYIKDVGKPNFTFSVGVGKDLRAAFIALKYAKVVGKDRVVIQEEGGSFRILEV
jgi:hypothetical protein